MSTAHLFPNPGGVTPVYEHFFNTLGLTLIY